MGNSICWYFLVLMHTDPDCAVLCRCPMWRPFPSLFRNNWSCHRHSDAAARYHTLEQHLLVRNSDTATTSTLLDNRCWISFTGPLQPFPHRTLPKCIFHTRCLLHRCWIILQAANGTSQRNVLVASAQPLSSLPDHKHRGTTTYLPTLPYLRFVYVFFRAKSRTGWEKAGSSQ